MRAGGRRPKSGGRTRPNMRANRIALPIRQRSWTIVARIWTDGGWFLKSAPNASATTPSTSAPNSAAAKPATSATTAVHGGQRGRDRGPGESRRSGASRYGGWGAGSVVIVCDRGYAALLPGEQ